MTKYIIQEYEYDTAIIPLEPPKENKNVSEGFSMYVGADAAKAALDSQSNTWEWPEDANTKGDPTKVGGEAYWTEPCVEITKCTLGPAKKDPTNRVQLMLQISAVPGMGSKNEGKRSLGLFYNFWPAAFGNSSHDKYTANNINLGSVLALLRAMGVELDPTQGVDLAMYFTPVDGQTFALNKRIGVLLRHNWYDGRPQQQAMEWLPASA